ncbi:primosomal protein N' [Sulfurimonas sp. HSL-3221]|uniref:primosomal protein N' n=1 Tax=Sulfurimonadaceae TaxID=2771471 RepID=UPI001E42905A|nr:primosomal protein N' [Sulfurimonas sp. HSL-3221]UFS63125.1 primosomal protein N' [Sulfurimonas sp. HSL-3221]
MPYFELSLLNTPLGALTYASDTPLEKGQIIEVSLQTRKRLGIVMKQVEQPAFETEKITALQSAYFKNWQIEFARFISEYYFCSLGEALGLFVPYDGLSNEVDQTLYGSIALSKRQEEVLTFLKKHPVSLLFGDTGSGKTEIYMKYFEAMLSQGKRSLFLMPEISLTPQMQKRLEAHFGDAVVMWHSKLTKKQKEKALIKIRSGEAGIIAGPRSALFLPIDDLGVIIVDEEHDDSYKSSSRPRYHARDMAIYYGKLLKIPVVLGSATPSLSSYVKFPHYRLKGGHFQSERAFEFEAHAEGITPKIESAIEATVAQKEQAMLFIPTRANFKYLICSSCGYTYECPFCSVGMSVHRYRRQVRCHYCGFAEAIPQHCPECQTGDLVSSRLGTAEAVEYFHEQQPQWRVAQFDRDKITTQKKLKELLHAFNEHEIDLLVGTQMLSKGHDYHAVTLAVVLGLDNLLSLSDYRARERALSLLLQIAGRSGRKKAARVIVQTFNAEFFSAYVDAYERFLEEEKLFREGMYPPYKKLCRVLFAHKKSETAEAAMRQMETGLKVFDTVEIVGAGKAPIEKIAGKYRYQILLRSDKSTDLIRALKTTKVPLAEIDMDPIEFG